MFKKIRKWLKGYDYQIKYTRYEKIVSWIFTAIYAVSAIIVILNLGDTKIVIPFGTMALFFLIDGVAYSSYSRQA